MSLDSEPHLLIFRATEEQGNDLYGRATHRGGGSLVAIDVRRERNELVAGRRREGVLVEPETGRQVADDDRIRLVPPGRHQDAVTLEKRGDRLVDGGRHPLHPQIPDPHQGVHVEGGENGESKWNLGRGNLILAGERGTGDVVLVLANDGLRRENLIGRQFG